MPVSGDSGKRGCVSWDLKDEKQLTTTESSGKSILGSVCRVCNGPVRRGIRMHLRITGKAQHDWITKN